MIDETNAGATEAPVETTATVEETKAVEAVETKTEQPEATATEEDAKTEATEPADEERKRLSGSERQKRKAARLAAELEETRRELAAIKTRQESASKPDARPGIDREPREDDYKDYFEFRDAKIAWDLKQTLRSEREAEVRSRAEAQERERLQELMDAHEEYAETVRERIPDFDKAIESAKGIRVEREVLMEILSSDKSALIQYHLANKPEKIRELNALSGRELAKEIGRLEARLHLPQPKKATEASKPPSIPSGGSAPTFNPFKTDDMDAYRKWREGGGGL